MALKDNKNNNNSNNNSKGTQGSAITAEQLYKLESGTPETEEDQENGFGEKRGSFSADDLAALEGEDTGLPSVGVTGPSTQAMESEYTNAYVVGTDAEAQAAYNQGFMDEMGNLAANAIVGETIGGTIEMVGNLVDLEDAWDLWTQNGEEIDRNFLSQLGSDIRKGTRENFRTYADYDKEKGESAFAPLDSSWWAKKGPSVASTLTTLFPSFAAVKALKGLGRITKLTSKLDDFARASKGEGFAESLAAGAEGVTQGILSRHMESMLESTRAYEEMRDEAIANGASEEEATRIASEEAATQYKQNAALGVVDIAQFMRIGKTPKLARMSRSSKMPKALEKIGKGAGDAAMEGAEEAVQFITAEEAKYRAGRRLGTEEYTDFEARISEYLGDEQFQTEAFMGALGGLAFQGVGKAMRKGFDKLSGRAGQMMEKDAGKQVMKDLHLLHKRLKEANDSNNQDAAEYTRNTINAQMAFNHAENGTLDKWRQTVASLKNTNAEQWNEQHPNTLISDDVVNRADEFLQEIDRIEEIWNQTAREFQGNEKRIPDIARRSYEIERLDNYKKQMDKEAEQSFNNYPGKNDLTDKGRQIFDQEMEIKSLEMTRDNLQYQIDNNLVKDKKEAQRGIDYANSLIEAAQKEIEGIKQGDTRTDQQAQNDNEIIEDAKKNADELPRKRQKAKLAEFFRKLNSKELAEYKNIKNKKSDIDKNVKQKRQILEDLANNTVPAPNEEIQEGDIVEFDSNYYTYQKAEKTSKGKTEHILSNYERPEAKTRLSDDQLKNKAVKRKPVTAESEQQKEQENAESYSVTQETPQETKEVLSSKEEQKPESVTAETPGQTEEVLGSTGQTQTTGNENTVEVGDEVTLNTPKGGEGTVVEDRGELALVDKGEEGKVQAKKENLTINQKGAQQATNTQENRQAAKQGVQNLSNSTGQAETTNAGKQESEQPETVDPAPVPEEDVDNPDHQLKEGMHLSWMSSQNTEWNDPEDRQGYNEARSKLLEDKYTQLEGNYVKYELFTDIPDKILDKERMLSDGSKSTIRQIIQKHQNGEELTKAEAGKLPIAVKLADEDGYVVKFDQDGNLGSGEYETIGQLHNDDYWNFHPEYRDQAKEEIRQNKKTIADNLRNGYVSLGMIEEKAGGFINFSDQNYRPLIAMAGKEYDSADNIELAILSSNSSYYKDKEELSTLLRNKVNSNESSVGGVFMGVRDAASMPFPLRLLVNNIDDNLAEVIYQSYKKIITDSNKNDQISDEVRKLLNNDQESDNVAAARKILGLEQNPDAEVTYAQLLENTVYEGKNQTNNTNTKLYLENGKVYIASREAPITTSDFQKEAQKQQFKEFLKNNKKFQINLAKLNQPEYKKTILDHVLNLNINPERARLFEQPRIKLSNTVEKRGTGSQNEPNASEYPTTTDPSVESQRIVKKYPETIQLVTTTNPSEGRINEILVPVDTQKLKEFASLDEGEIIEIDYENYSTEKEAEEAYLEYIEKTYGEAAVDYADLDDTELGANLAAYIRDNPELTRALVFSIDAKDVFVKISSESNSIQEFAQKILDYNAKTIDRAQLDLFSQEQQERQQGEQPQQQEQSQQQEEQEQESLEEYIRRINNSNDVSKSDDFDTDFRITDNNTNYQAEDIEGMQKWLREKLNLEADVVDGLINVNKKGKKAFGAFRDGAIILSNQAEQGTAYHEAFHAVSRTMLTNDERSNMYDDAASLYGINRNDETKLEERLAEDFRIYQSKPRNLTLTENIRKFFMKLQRIINQVINRPNVRDKVFNRISTGYFVNNDQMTVTNQKVGDQTFYRRVEGFSDEETQEWGKAIAFLAIRRSILETKREKLNNYQAWGEPVENGHPQSIKNIAIEETDQDGNRTSRYPKDDDELSSRVKNTLDFEDVSQPDFGLVRPSLRKFALQAYKAKNYQMAEKYKFIDENFGSFIPVANQVLESLGIVQEGDTQRRVLKEEDESADEDQKTDWENLKPTFETSDKANMTNTVKMLVAMTPKSQINSKGEREPVLSDYTGLPTFNNFPETWKYLKKKLADVVPFYDDQTGDIVDPVETMMDRMRALSSVKPEFGFIINKLSEWDNYKKGQFYKAIQGTVRDFLFTTIGETQAKKKQDRRTTVNIGSATQERLIGQIQSRWVENYKSNLVKNNNEINVDKAKALVSKFKGKKTSIRNEAAKNAEKQSEDKHFELIERLQNVLNGVGIEMTQPGIREAIHNRNSADKFEGLNDLLRDLENIFSIRKTGRREPTIESMAEFEDNRNAYTQEEELRSPITNEKVVRELAEIESGHTTNLAEFNVLGPQNKQIYPLSENNYMTTIISELKNESNPVVLQDRKRDPANTNSYWINWLDNANNRKKFKHHNQLSIRRVRRGDTGTDYGETSPSDDLMDRVHKVLRGYYPQLTPADKPSFYFFSGPELIKSPQAQIDQFAKYMFDEYMSVRKTYHDLFGEDKLSDEELVENHHYTEMNDDGTPDRNSGNGIQFQLFPELNDDGGLLNELENIVRDKENNNRPVIPDVGFLNNKKVRNHIAERLNKMTRETTQYAIDNYLVGRNENDSQLFNKNIDSEIFDTYLQNNDQNAHKAVRNLLKDFTVNATIGYIEQVKLFTGGISFYKNFTDFTKRVPGAAAPGQGLRIYRGTDGTYEVRPNFNAAITEGIKKDALSKEIKESLKKSGFSEEQAKQVGSSFANTDQTDASAWITVDRWVEIMKGLGEEASIPENIEAIRKGKELPSLISMQSIKGQHFELSAERTGTNIPTYLKYSQAVLFPALTKETQLDELRKAMENNTDKDGNADPVDEVVVDNGIKAGIKKKTKIDDENGNLLNTDQINLNPIRLSNRYWKRQNQMGHKGIHETQEGSQVKAVIMGDINPESEFYVPEEETSKEDNKINGQDLVQRIHNTEMAMSDSEAHKLQTEFMTTDPTTVGDEQFIVNHDRFRQLIADAIGSNNAPKDVFDALKENVPIEALANHRVQVENKLASIINKTGARTGGLGAGLIQMSNFGLQPKKSQNLTADERGRITWIKREEELKATRIEQDENGRDVAKPGQFLMPHPALQELRNKEGMENLSDEELVKRLKSDPKLLQTINYRIPTQGLPTIDAGEIVGILPPEAGDTIVAYTDITTKTGSDFDIDKMSVMVPHFGINQKGEVYALPFMTEKNSTLKERFNTKLKEIEESRAGKDLMDNLQGRSFEEAAIEEGLIPDMETFGNLPIEQQNTTKRLYNRKINLYRSIILSVEKYKDLMDPLEELPHMDIANKIAQKQGYEQGYQTSVNSIDQFSPVRQLQEKSKFMAAAAGVGQAANQYKHHILSQSVDFRNVDIFGENVANAGIVNITNEGMINMSALRDVKGELISKNLYGYISGYVDIANEPWPGFVNANTFTNAVAFLMLRSGASLEFTMNFIAQPAIIEAAKENARQTSKIGEKQYKNGQPLDAIEVVQAKLAEMIKAQKDPNAAPRAVGQVLAEIEGNTREDKETELYNNLAENLENAPDLEKQLDFLTMFSNLKSEAKFLTDAVQASRMDVNGYGKDLIEAFTTQNLKRKVEGYEFGRQTGDGEPRMMGFSDMMANTMLKSHYKNTVQFALNNFRGLFLSANEDVKATLNQMSAELQKGSQLTDSDLGSSIRDGMYTFLNSNFENFQLSWDQMNRLFKDKQDSKSVGTRLQGIRQEDSEISNMSLIQVLQTESDKEGNKFVSVSGAQNFDPVTEQTLRDDWADLLVHEREDIRQFAEDLVKHAFYSSGFTKNLNAFHNLIPLNYFMTRDYSDFVSQNVVNVEQLDMRSFREFFYKNNADNTNIVPKIRSQITKPAEGNTGQLNKKEVFRIKEDNKNEVSAYIDGYQVNTPYINMNGNLFAFAGYDSNKLPVYVRTNKLGYKQGKQQVAEYRAAYPDSHRVSVFDNNNVTLSDATKEYVNNLPQSVKDINYNARAGSTTQASYRQGAEDMINDLAKDQSEQDIVNFYANLTNEEQQSLPTLDAILDDYRGRENTNSADFVQNLIDTYINC